MFVSLDSRLRGITSHLVAVFWQPSGMASSSINDGANGLSGLKPRSPSTLHFLLMHVEHQLLFDFAQPGLDYCLVLAASPHEGSLSDGTPFNILVG